MNQSIFAYGYLNNGLVYQKQGNFEKAIIEFNKAIEESPQYAAAFQNRGNAFSSLMNFEQALKDYSMAIKINPQYSAAYFNRGLLFGRQAQFEKAIMDYNQFIQMVPDNAQAYNNRANAYQNLGYFIEAIQDYSKSIEINPQYVAAYNNRDFGNAYVNSGKYIEAILDCSKAIELQMINADAYYIRGNAYKNQEKFQEAIIDYSKAVEINSQHSAAYYNRGLIYLDQRTFDKSILDFSKAIEIFPANPLYHFSLGFLFFSLKQFGLATQYFESAFKYSQTISIQQRLQFQLSKDKIQLLQKKIEIISSIKQQLQNIKEEMQDLQRINKISQTQYQQYQFEINDIENQFFNFIPLKSNENFVEILMTLKLFMDKIKIIQNEIYKKSENYNIIKTPNKTLISNLNQDLSDQKKQMNPDSKLYYSSLFWHLFNYFSAINLISKDLFQINIESHSEDILKIQQQIVKLTNQDEGYVPIIDQIFKLFNTALDENSKDNKFDSRIYRLLSILQVFVRIPSEYEREIQNVSLFLANNVKLYSQKVTLNTFNLYVNRISILEFAFEQMSQKEFWKAGILHTLIILNYLTENYQEIIIQSFCCTFKDIVVKAIIQYNSESLQKNQIQK